MARYTRLKNQVKSIFVGIDLHLNAWYVTIGLFGSDQLVAFVISRIDERYTVAGEMMSKEEARKYHRSYFQNLFERKLPRGEMSVMSFEWDSFRLEGKEFTGVKVTHMWGAGASEGRMYEYLPVGFVK